MRAEYPIHRDWASKWFTFCITRVIISHKVDFFGGRSINDIIVQFRSCVPHSPPRFSYMNLIFRFPQLGLHSVFSVTIQTQIGLKPEGRVMS